MGLGGDELVAFWRRVYIVKSCLTKLEGTHKIKGGGANFFNSALHTKIPYYDTRFFFNFFFLVGGVY